MKALYFETITLIERLHQLFLDVVKTELDRLRIFDINKRLIETVIGDESGRFRTLIRPGVYEFSFAHQNYEPQVIPKVKIDQKLSSLKIDARMRQLSPVV